MMRWRPAVLLWLVFLFVSASAQAADQVRTRGWGYADYGRLVFDWPSTVQYSARTENGKLIVRFERPMTTDLNSALQRLGDYLSGGSVSTDGQVATFDMTGALSIRPFVNANSVVVDLRRSNAGEKIADGAVAPAGKPPLSLGVRVGDHPGYTRIVFDWPRSVQYTVDHQGAALSLRFDQPARIGAAQIQSSLPEGISNLAARIDGAALLVSMNLRGDSGVRHFRSGTKVVVDIVAGAAPQKEAQKPESVAGVANTPPPAAKPAVTQSVVAEPLAAASDGAQSSQETGQAEDTQVVQETSTETASGPTRLVRRADQPQPTVSVQPQQAAVAAEVPAVVVTQQAAASTVAQPVVASDGQKAKPVSLTFEWTESTGAAVFQRAGFTWVIFDRRAPIDLAPMRAAGGNTITKLEQLPIAGSTVLRIATLPGVSPAVRRDNYNWIIDFATQRMSPDIDVNVEAEIDSSIGSRILVATTDVGSVLRIPDPEVGDMMQIATITSPGIGVDGARVYPEFHLIPSVQGVVVQAMDDELELKVEDIGLSLNSVNGLHISAITAARTKLSVEISGELILNTFEWRLDGAGDFIARRQALATAITEVPPEKRNEARLDLARFYFANGLGAEALGILRLVAQDNPGIATQPEFRALRAASAIITRHLEEAAQEIQDPRLDKYREILLWRGILAYEDGDIERAIEYIRGNDGPLQGYSLPLMTKLGLIVITTMFEARDVETAGKWIDILSHETDTMSRSQLADLRYQQGRLAEAQGNIELATELWDRLGRSQDLFSSVRAEMALISLGLSNGNTPASDAIKRLEYLRFRWRGDEIELSILRQLGDLYLASDDYRNGLSILRTAATHFAGNDQSKEITEQMTDAFTRLYLGGQADTLKPVTALALYDEFRELTPAGQKGDDIIQKLADRLVNVDLLHRAAQLLEHQIRFRLQAIPKARVGAKLALIQLLDRNPEAAIAALKSSEFPNMPLDVADDRRRIRAKANFELGRRSEAISLLAGDISHEADLLKADIYWQGEDWAQAARILQRLVGNPPGENTTYDSGQAQIVLNLAVALQLNNDRAGLKQLRALYGPAMQAGPLRDSFDFISRGSVGGATDISTITRQLSEVEHFDTFLANYRERLLPTRSAADTSTQAAPAT